MCPSTTPSSRGSYWPLVFGLAVVTGSICVLAKWYRRAPLPLAYLPASPAAAPPETQPHSNEPPKLHAGMVLISGGPFRMGSDQSPRPDCRPQHEVTVGDYWIDACEVTVTQFAQFVDATGYVTTAERAGRAWVFEPARRKWTKTAGADWRHPRGPHSSTFGHENLPVVQVSWHDASAYAAWAGKRLPREAEWEYAARAGLYDADFPWGRTEKPDDTYQANYWQGWFPDQDLGQDGFSSLAPVASYPANRFGLYDMAGNVWEWCADWYSENYYESSAPLNPIGPAAGTKRVQRGGSWLCAENSPAGYRVWSRASEAPEACHNHVGFRCAADAR